MRERLVVQSTVHDTVTYEGEAGSSKQNGHNTLTYEGEVDSSNESA